MAHLYLVGNMGSGKTTIGEQVAQRLGMSFTDLDRDVEWMAGQTIAELFAQRGEEAFRQLEREALARTIILMDTVVATGGGVVLREDNRALMRRKGWVIYLRVARNALATPPARDRPTPAAYRVALRNASGDCTSAGAAVPRGGLGD